MYNCSIVNWILMLTAELRCIDKVILRFPHAYRYVYHIGWKMYCNGYETDCDRPVCTVFNIRCIDEIVQHLLRHDSSQYQSHLFDCIIFFEFELFPEKNNVIDIYGI